jgi:PAS domain S-box-containing protein
MNELSNDILLALAYVSQISDPDMVRSRFFESINVIDDALSFEYAEHRPAGIPEHRIIPIATIRSSFGYAVMDDDMETTDAEHAVFRNAFRFLAVIIENRIQERALVSRNKSLLKEIKQEKSLARTILDTLPVGVWVTDEKGQILMCNTAGEKIWAGIQYVGIERYDAYRAWWPETGEPVRQEEWAITRAVRNCITSIAEEINIECFDGTYKTILNSAAPILDDENKIIGAVCINQDITDRKQAEEQIKKSLAEKETLLRELYHRTKNSMAVIISLLSMQSETFDDKSIVEAFTEATNRISSMALVHQKLYEAKDLSSINLKIYISELVPHMMKSFNISTGLLSLEFDMEDVFILIDTAIPCGLILNELITNSFKYAFPDNREGIFKVKLYKNESGEIELTVSDNGKGVSPGFDFRRDGHLGVQVIFALGENQLQGQVAFETEQGVACHLKFRDIFFEPRV